MSCCGGGGGGLFCIKKQIQHFPHSALAASGGTDIVGLPAHGGVASEGQALIPQTSIQVRSLQSSPI